MDYNPEENPRYLGPDLFEEQAEEEALGLEKNELAAQASALTEALNTFESPGWQHIAADLQKRQDSAIGHLLHGTIENRIEEDRVRGRIQTLQQLLNLPELWRLHREQVLDQLSDLDGPAIDADTRD